MPHYTLTPGSACGHNGRDLKVGEVIVLPVHVGRELAGKLSPCTKEGKILTGLTPEEIEIEQAEEHEKDSLREIHAARAAKTPKPAAARVDPMTATTTPESPDPSVAVVPTAQVAPDGAEK